MIRRCLTAFRALIICSVCMALLMAGASGRVLADAASPSPQDGAIGVEGKIPSNPPTTAPTITTPRSGQGFSTLPVQVSGLCTSGLLVKVFSNNVFVGSAICDKGSYSLQVDLFSGRNDLVAKVFDSLDQGGPDSNVVSVTFNDAQFNPFGGSLLSLTSNYAERGSDPGKQLVWPIVLSGGTGPYAISVDWGDGKAADLMSSQFAGTIELKHVYDSAGIYKVIVKATDKNGLSAFLQLVAIANGAVTSKSDSDSKDKGATVIVRILWLPAVLCIPLLFLSFWLGRRYELAALRRHLEQHRIDDDE